MIRPSARVAAGLVLMVAASGCSKDSAASKTDSAAADSIRDAHDAATADTATASEGGSAPASAQGAINSTEGTIGETRKPVRMQKPDTGMRDSVVFGPYRRIDSTGDIKR